MLDSDAINAGLECGSVFSTQVARAKVKVAGVITRATAANIGEFRSANKVDPVAPSKVPTASKLHVAVPAKESMLRAWHLRLDQHTGAMLNRMIGAYGPCMCSCYRL
jgi:hypothetical protein